jgi:hypothetical protein
MSMLGVTSAQAAGPTDFGTFPGQYAGNAGCVGGNCPTGNCRNGDCGLGGCANGMCNSPTTFNQFGYAPSQPRLASNSPLTNSYGGNAFYGQTARSSCPGGVCPPVGQGYTASYRPQVPNARCATGNCPTTMPRYPAYQQPRFSFLGLRF